MVRGFEALFPCIMLTAILFYADMGDTYISVSKTKGKLTRLDLLMRHHLPTRVSL